MRMIKKIAITSATVLAFTAGSIPAFATSEYPTPADAVAELTGRDRQSVIEERVQTDKTYGTIAKEAGVLDQFKVQVLEIKKNILSNQVQSGTLTQEQADVRLARIEAHQTTCDGTACDQPGAHDGAGPGYEKGQGLGPGYGQGEGLIRGHGNRQDSHGIGHGPRDGSCQN